MASALQKRIQEFTVKLFSETIQTRILAANRLLAIANDWFDVIEEELRVEKIREKLEVFDPIMSTREKFSTA